MICSGFLKQNDFVHVLKDCPLSPAQSNLANLEPDILYTWVCLHAILVLVVCNNNPGSSSMCNYNRTKKKPKLKTS